MPAKIRNTVRAALLAAAALPLLQVACTTEALSRSLANEIVNAATQFTFDVSQTVLFNVFGL